MYAADGTLLGSAQEIRFSSMPFSFFASLKVIFAVFWLTEIGVLSWQPKPGVEHEQLPRWEAQRFCRLNTPFVGICAE